MNRNSRLRECSKFLAGLVTGDLIFGFLLLIVGSLPQSVFGWWITVPEAWLWVLIDILLLILLTRYGWSRKAYRRTA